MSRKHIVMRIEKINLSSIIFNSQNTNHKHAFYFSVTNFPTPNTPMRLSKTPCKSLLIDMKSKYPVKSQPGKILASPTTTVLASHSPTLINEYHECFES